MRFHCCKQESLRLGISKPDKYWDSVVLLSCVGGCGHPDKIETFRALLIDKQGNFVNGWQDINAIPSKMFPSGNIMGGQGGGFGGSAVVQQDWCGDEVWRWDVVGGRWHHDINRKNSWSGDYLPQPGHAPKEEGYTLVLANHVPGDNYYYEPSWTPEGHPARDTSHISLYPLLDDAIYMVDKKGRIKWQWFASDHFEEMSFSDVAKDGVMSENVGRGGSTDWTHFNNVNWLGPNQWYEQGDLRFHPDNVIFDSRTSGMIGIIDKETKDIVWKIGPEFGPGTAWHEANNGEYGPIIGPHNAKLIGRGLPWEGNIIVFDNGGNSGYGALDYGAVTGCPGTYPVNLRDYSRVLIIDPQTLMVVWEYKCTNGFYDEDGNWNRKFFSSFISNAQVLPNGNVAITEGNQARIFEVTPGGEIVWEYYAYAATGGPGVIGRALYRSYQYPTSWVPNYITCE